MPRGVKKTAPAALPDSEVIARELAAKAGYTSDSAGEFFGGTGFHIEEGVTEGDTLVALRVMGTRTQWGETYADNIVRAGNDAGYAIVLD